MTQGMHSRSVRPTWAEIDLAAITHNVQTIKTKTAPAKFCAVVKAFAYGHGLVRVAETAVRAGADYLAVALVEEGRALRNAGIDEPILLLSEPLPNAMAELVESRLIPTLYSREGMEALASEVPVGERYPVHVKVDSGMHRVGINPNDAIGLIEAIAKHDRLTLEGVFTHLAVADELDNAYTGSQLERFQSVLDALATKNIAPTMVHAANSAAALAHPQARFDLVRVGIAMYGVPPSGDFVNGYDLHPAMSLHSRVTYVKRVPANSSVSYGMHYQTSNETTLATLPVGYADGVVRELGLCGGEVLLGGKRFPIAGAVTMDQVVIDCGDEDVHIGDEAVLLGRQGNEEISAWEWAEKLGTTIDYTIVTGISSRVPRRYVQQ